jgi:hypothetical protein
MVPAFFRDLFIKKAVGLHTYKPSSQELGDKRDFCIKRLRSLNSNNDYNLLSDWSEIQDGGFPFGSKF